ncbi:MAG: hypothetical protein U5L09_19680 [Bacteroidales bacterium]|nr:hypothetical protein [Bacteroidales bacterium]
MIRKMFFPALIMLVAVTSCTTTFESRWHSSAFEEQKDTQNYQYDSDAGIMYLISNTKDSLYVDLKFPDNITARKVRAAGLTVWLDPEAKKNKAYGILFPLPVKGDNPEFRRAAELPEVVEGVDGFKRLKYPKHGRGGSAQKLIRENLDMQLTGFGKERKGPVVPAYQTDISLRLFYDQNNILSYHMALPLQKIGEDTSLEKNTLSVGIVSGHLKRPDRREDMTRRNPGTGGRRGGLMPGRTQGYHQSRNHDFSRLTIPSEVWIKKVYLKENE